MPARKPRLELLSPAEVARLTLSGKIRIPPIENPFRWGRSDVARLWDSLYRGYPMSPLLLWERPAPAATVEVGPLEFQVPAVPDAWWVVDGQQRVIALTAVLSNEPGPVNPAFRIFFDEQGERFASYGRREQVPDSLVPVSSLDIGYQMPAYIVRGADDQQVMDIFGRLNTSGNPLPGTEILRALRVAGTQMEPSSLDMLAARVRGFGFGKIPERVLEEIVRAIDGESALASAERTLGHAIDFLRDECGVPHVRVLPYDGYLPVLARFAALSGPPAGRAAELLRRWIWRLPASAGMKFPQEQFLDAIDQDAAASAERLLRMVPQGGVHWVPEVYSGLLTAPPVKLSILALIDLHPRLLADGVDGHAGDPIDVASLADSPQGMLVGLLDRFDDLAQLLIHPRRLKRDLWHAITHADLDDDVLRSQCLDEKCVELLRTYGEVQFHRYRAELMTGIIKRNVQRRALFGFPDGPEPASLFGDEGDTDDGE